MAEQERTPKVLIVDDDPRLRDLLRRYLGDNGFSVSVADGAPAMNRIWMRERFDALILDLMLPGEDGLQILCLQLYQVEGERLAARILQDGLHRPVQYLRRKDFQELRFGACRLQPVLVYPAESLFL